MPQDDQAVADGYVDVTARVQPQAKLDAAALPLPTVAPLVDKDATQRTAQTYAMLRGIAATQNVVYGHQNEMNRKVSTLPGRRTPTTSCRITQASSASTASR